MRLHGKVAIITASGSGMGRAAATLMAREGAKVVVADISEPAGEATVKLIKDAGGEATFVRVDVAKISDLEKMVEAAVEAYGQLNVLYNHAGIPGPAGIENVSVEEWDQEVAVNLRSGFFGTKFAIPKMRQAGGGSIIFTASVSGIVASSSAPAYGATKGGLVNLTRSLALTLAGDKIRVNCICPGPMDTPMLPQFFNRPGRTSDPEALTMSFLTNVPLGRLGTPEEVGYAALFLASDESSFITGAILPVDGGYTAR